MDPFKDLVEQGFRYKNLCHLERYVAGMPYDLCQAKKEVPKVIFR